MSYIKFIAVDKQVFDDFPHPKMSSSFIPNWYKEMPSLIGNSPYIGANGNPNATVKKCIPFRDSMTSGYMIPLPADVYVSHKGKQMIINSSYQGNTDLVLSHEIEQLFMYPIPEGYCKAAFKWNNPWLIKTKRNWSTLFVQPMHHDLPFLILSGLVDTDKHPIPVNFPFFIKEDFEGIIPKGTPIAQCIPIKREKVTAYVSYGIDRFMALWRKATTKAFDRYKENFHSKKVYKIKETNTELKCPFAKFFKKEC